MAPGASPISGCDASQVIPVIATACGGVVRSQKPGQVWVYVPIPSYPHASMHPVVIRGARVSGWLGASARFRGVQIFRDMGQPLSDYAAMPGIVSNQAVPDVFVPAVSVPVVSCGVVVASQVDFNGGSEDEQAYFVLWSAQVEYELLA